jgi:hypothetical protein
VTRVILADTVAQVQDADGRTWGGNRPGKVFDVDPDTARGIVAIGGAECSMAGTARRSTGYRCPSCGFGSYLRRCGRCGEECHRE